MKMINRFLGLDLPFALVPYLTTIHLQFLFHPGRGRCLTLAQPSATDLARLRIAVFAERLSPSRTKSRLSLPLSFCEFLHLFSPSIYFASYEILILSRFTQYFCTSTCVIKRLLFFLEFFFPSSYATKYNKKIIRFCNRISAIFAPQTVISIANWRGNILIFPYVRTRSGSGIIINYETFPRDG